MITVTISDVLVDFENIDTMDMIVHHSNEEEGEF
jgi:hypothetical protein